MADRLLHYLSRLRGALHRFLSAAFDFAFLSAILVGFFVIWAYVVVLALAGWVILAIGPISSRNSMYFLVDPNRLSVNGAIFTAAILMIVFAPSWQKPGVNHDGPNDSAVVEFLSIFLPRRLRGAIDDASTAMSIPVALLWVGVLFVALLGIFAAADLEAFQIGGCFHGVDGRANTTNAMYFTIGDLTTAGTGSVYPLSNTCRAMTAWQTGFGTAVILLGLSGVLWWVQDGFRGGASHEDGRHEKSMPDPPSDP